jgi:hypothetical protein
VNFTTPARPLAALGSVRLPRPSSGDRSRMVVHPVGAVARQAQADVLNNVLRTFKRTVKLLFIALFV